jgi:hypothetical protein
MPRKFVLIGIYINSMLTSYNMKMFCLLFQKLIYMGTYLKQRNWNKFLKNLNKVSLIT